MPQYSVSCLDTFEPEVERAIAGELPEGFTIRFAKTMNAAEHAQLVREADFILMGGGHLPGDMLEQASRLKLIQKFGIGVDKIDIDAARRLGIPVTITAGANATPVAELAVALMLAVYRRIPYADRKLREGQWIKSEMRVNCFQIGGKTIGLLGFGAIARMVALRLRGFDVRIIYHDINRADRITEAALGASYVPLPELFATSDILSVHTPLTTKTRNIIDRNAIASMKDGAVLINTARGGIIDEQALHDAIVSGKLRGAGLDSFDEEPLPKGHPLTQLDRVVLMPHAGGGTFDNVANVARHAFGNMTRLLRGENFSPVDVIVPPKTA